MTYEQPKGSEGTMGISGVDGGVRQTGGSESANLGLDRFKQAGHERMTIEYTDQRSGAVKHMYIVNDTLQKLMNNDPKTTQWLEGTAAAEGFSDPKYFSSIVRSEIGARLNAYAEYGAHTNGATLNLVSETEVSDATVEKGGDKPSAPPPGGKAKTAPLKAPETAKPVGLSKADITAKGQAFANALGNHPSDALNLFNEIKAEDKRQPGALNTFKDAARTELLKNREHAASIKAQYKDPDSTDTISHKNFKELRKFVTDKLLAGIRPGVKESSEVD
jgi:hypothetical protein